MAKMSSTREESSQLSMRLFGLPYQFHESVDPRLSNVNQTVGKNYTEKIMLETPVLTVIPGIPKYLPDKSRGAKKSTTYALFNVADGGFAEARSKLASLGRTDKELRLFDFEKAYTEYMGYVNVLCRAGATYLSINDQISTGSVTSDFQSFNWSNYKWNNRGKMSTASKLREWAGNFFNGSEHKMTFDNKGTSSGDLFTTWSNYDYVQFAIDPESSSASDDFGNATSESQLKSLFENGSGMMKEIAWMANATDAGGKLNNFADESMGALNEFVANTLNGSGTSGSVFGALSRIINIGGNVLKGENIIIPNIYQSSEYSKSYNVNIKLKTPYGDKLSYYLDIFVPLMHLLALVMPKQTSGASYKSPFIVKAYVEGSWSVNLGMVTALSITRSPESRSVEGLPNEVEVSMTISDLYTDLTMTPANNVTKFATNSSLVEFLATNCGMSLTKPNFEKKLKVTTNNIVNRFRDIVPSIKGTVEQYINAGISSILDINW